MSIIRLLSLAVLFVCALTRPTQGQTATDLNEGLQVVPNPSGPPGTHTVSWWGRTGFAYFIQTSLDLQTWSYVPLIESGANAPLSWGFQSNAPRLFVRLYCRPGYNPANAATTDSDNDGVPDLTELNLGNDPFILLGPNGQPEWWSQHTIPPLHLPNQTPPSPPPPSDVGPVGDAYPASITPFPSVPEPPPSLTYTGTVRLAERNKWVDFTGYILNTPEGSFPAAYWNSSESYTTAPNYGDHYTINYEDGYWQSFLDSLSFGPFPEAGWLRDNPLPNILHEGGYSMLWNPPDDPPSEEDWWFTASTHATRLAIEYRLECTQPAPPGGLRQRYLVVEANELLSPPSLVSTRCIGAVTLVIPEGELHSTQTANTTGQINLSGGTDYRAILLSPQQISSNTRIFQWLIPFHASLTPSADDSLVDVLSPVDTPVDIAFSLWQNTLDSTPETPTNLFTGGQIQFTLSGPGSLSSPTATLTSDGMATTTLTPPPNPGTTAQLRAKIQNFKCESLFPGITINCSSLNLTFDSDPIRYIHPAPKVELTPATHTFVADATDTLSFTATGTDTLNNPLPDGTPVTWLINGAPAQIAQDSSGTRQIQTQLVNGSATATLRSPSPAGTITLTAQIGTASDTATVTGTVPTAQITSTASTLDIAQGDSATLTLNTDAADGTVVNWFASNGTLAQRATTVTGGTTSTTLLSGIQWGARKGAVEVFAHISGQKLVGWVGNFIFGGNTPHIELNDNYLVGPNHSTTARLIAPGMAGRRVRLFVNHAQVVRTNSTALIIGPDGTATFSVISTVEPDLGATAQIHAEIEHIPPSGPPTYTSVSTHIHVLNYAAFTSTSDFFVGALGGDPVGAPGAVGGFVGGLLPLPVTDAASVAKNIGRMAGWQDGDVDNVELLIATFGIVLTGNALDIIPSVLRPIRLAIKTLPTDQAAKAGDLMWALTKEAFGSFARQDDLWKLLQRISLDPALIQAVFKAADGSLETLKAVAQSFAFAGDTYLTAVRSLPLATAEQILNATPALKCMNDALANPQMLARILQQTGRIEEALHNLAKVLALRADGTPRYLSAGDARKAMEKTASVSKTSGTYHIFDFVLDAKDLVVNCPDVTGLATFTTRDILSHNALTQISSFLFELRVNANFAKTGNSVATIGDGGTFRDVVLTDGRVYEVKKSAEAVLNTFSALFQAKTWPKTITQQDWDDAAAGLIAKLDQMTAGSTPTALIINIGQGAGLNQKFLDLLDSRGIELMEMAAPFL